MPDQRWRAFLTLSFCEVAAVMLGRYDWRNYTSAWWFNRCEPIQDEL